MKDVLERATKIDEQRSDELKLLQDKHRQLAEWNAKVNELRGLLDRDITNLPTQHEVDKLEFARHCFKK